MSFNKRLAFLFPLFLASWLIPLCPASSATLSGGTEFYFRVIAAVSRDDSRLAKKLLSRMRPASIEGLSDIYRARLDFLKLWYFPRTRFSGDSVRMINRVGGNLSDFLFWRSLNSGKIPDARLPNLREKLSRMFPFSPLFHGPGRLDDHSARFIWKESLAALDGGDRPRAIHLWTKLVEKHPLAPESGLAAHRLGSRMLSGEILLPRWTELVSMGMGKLAAREAHEYLALSPPFPYRDRAVLLLAQEDGREGKAQEGRKILSTELSRKGIRLDSLLQEQKCRLFSRFSREADCVGNFLVRYPSSLEGRRLSIQILRQDLLKGKGSLNPAWKPSDNFLSTPEGQDSLWLYGLDAYFRGNRLEAQEDWTRLADHYHVSGDSSGFRAGRVSYFLGRLAALSGDGETAKTWYRLVIAQYSDSPYALWAGLACGSVCPALPVRLHSPKTRRDQWPERVRSRILRLVQMGLWGPAWTLYTLRENSLRIGYRMFRYGGMDLIVSPEEKFLIIRRLSGLKSSGLWLSGGEEITPEILHGIRRSGVDPDWALAIARQESRFEGKALSIDGALGIMQLMPRTAIATARNSSDGYYQELSRNLGRIRFPETNSYLGSLYLSKLLSHYPRNPERAVASYNAGLHSVVRWKRLSREDWDFFVEGIPYQETRRYDREVLWNYLYIHNLEWRKRGQGQQRVQR
ncbi:MAG: lytic transglycosylase domain-containing protein [Leptospirales bacterium]